MLQQRARKSLRPGLGENVLASMGSARHLKTALSDFPIVLYVTLPNALIWRVCV